ncbi:hypothetical protein Avbf_18288 [Armadillidium vulgare]|nr:hypothetical protein Avbf_18288 [Armadillidium vulgare]
MTLGITKNIISKTKTFFVDTLGRILILIIGILYKICKNGSPKGTNTKHGLFEDDMRAAVELVSYLFKAY